MVEHPKRITYQYAAQFRRPEDSLREKEEAERREALEAHIEERKTGSADNEGVLMFDEAWNTALEQFAPEDDAVNEGVVNGEVSVNAAILSAARTATARVDAAFKTREERIAEAVAEKLRPTLDAEDDSLSDMYETTDEERARLDAELELSDGDPLVGYDEQGNSVYQTEDGEQYIVDAAA